MEKEKRKTVRRPKRNAFDYDLDGLREQSSKPHPIKDKDGLAISTFLTRLSGRAQTGWVANWKPDWARDVRPFRYFFFEDKLCIDTYEGEYGPPGSDVDAFIDSADMEFDIQAKLKLCAENNLLYIGVRPDEDLDTVQLAGKLGKTKVNKEETAASQGGKIQ